MAPDSGIPISQERGQDSLTRARRRRVLIAAAVGLLIVIGVVLFFRHSAAVSADNKRKGDANRAIPVRAVAATTGNVDRTVDALGTVAALNTVTVRSRVDGPLVEVPFREGELVNAGDLLARIDPRTFQVALDQATGLLGHDQSQLADARVDLNRYTGLLAKDSIAKQTVDSQKYMVKQLQGTVRSDQAQVDSARLQLGFTRITAPFPGRVGLRQIDVGNMVHAADTTGIVVLTQTHPITVVFALPSEQLSQILPHWRAGDPLAVDALDRNGQPQSHGQVLAIDNQIDPTTGTVKVKAQFANTDDALYPSEFVTARLKIETLTGQTLVPSAAVQRGTAGTFVYVVNADNTVSMRKVTVGPAAGDLVSVTAGVKTAERVVIDGLDKLRDGAKIAVIPPGPPAAAAGDAPKRSHGATSSTAGGKATP